MAKIYSKKLPPKTFEFQGNYDPELKRVQFSFYAMIQREDGIFATYSNAVGQFDDTREEAIAWLHAQISVHLDKVDEIDHDIEVEGD